MSYFLFQNSILGNDPLVKKKTIINPCENQPFELPRMSLLSKAIAACTVFGWHCGEDRTVGTEDWQQWDYTKIALNVIQTAGKYICPCTRLKERACNVNSGLRKVMMLQFTSTWSSKTQPHRRSEIVGRKSHRVNNSPKQLTQKPSGISTGNCLWLYPVTH